MPRKKVSETDAVKTNPEIVEETKVDETKVDETKVEDAAANQGEDTTSPEGVLTDDANPEIPDSVAETIENPAASVRRKRSMGVLKIDKNEEEELKDDEEAVVWHELAVMNRSKKIVPAVMTGLERTANLDEVVIAYYKTQRIVIPLSEMNIDLASEGEYLDGTWKERLVRVCNTMLGAEIDVLIRGMDKKTGSIVASRRDAMEKKRERFYLRNLPDGLPQIRVGRVVEARIIGVTPQVARFDVFGLEVSLPASQLGWDWVSDVSERYFVGDKMKLLVTEIEGDSVDNLKIKVDAKSQIVNTSKENLRKCSVQGRYIGQITSVRNGVAYLRLKIGVNAIAHTNNDKRTPGKGDMVSFVITRVNYDYGNVSGIITKIIKQVL